MSLKEEHFRSLAEEQKLEFIKMMVEDQRTNKLTNVETVEKHGIGISTYYRWKKELQLNTIVDPSSKNHVAISKVEVCDKPIRKLSKSTEATITMNGVTATVSNYSPEELITIIRGLGRG
jgi:transposase-like protein